MEKSFSFSKVGGTGAARDRNTKKRREYPTPAWIDPPFDFSSRPASNSGASCPKTREVSPLRDKIVQPIRIGRGS